MKGLSYILLMAMSLINVAQADEFNAKAFAQQYFSAWTATQAPDATAKDIEHYLSLVKDNVGHQHYPYDADDTRAVDGKAKMLKGMTYYLNAHSEYKGTLLSVEVGFNVIIIKYNSTLKAIHPQTKALISMNKDTVEVLEIEDGKVAMIRKYSE
ncbi:MAG: nuclear transport factor 2 family protein [Colwelliaceae bacterium]|nr:nuclear transport factor 2 family protein [Colwelliaceae bacterium]